MNDIKHWIEDKNKRVLILLDGYDESNDNGWRIVLHDFNQLELSDPSQLRTLINRTNANTVLVVSTRTHKTDELIGNKEHLWSLVKCVGLKRDRVTPFIRSRLCKCGAGKCDCENVAKLMHEQLNKNNLGHNPLFIILACNGWTPTSTDGCIAMKSRQT